MSRIKNFLVRLPLPSMNAAGLLEAARTEPYRIIEKRTGDTADLTIVLGGVEHRLATGEPNVIEGLRLEVNAMLTLLGRPDAPGAKKAN